MVGGTWRQIVAVSGYNGGWRTIKTVYGYVSGAWIVLKDFGPPANKTLSYSGFASSPTASPPGSGMYYMQINITYGTTSGPLWGDGEFIGIDFYKDTGGDGNFFLAETRTFQSPDTSPSGAFHTGYIFDSNAGDQGYVNGYWTNSSGLRSFEFTTAVIVPGP